MSQLAQHEIETIVRMVLDRLRDSGLASANQPGSKQPSASQPTLAASLVSNISQSEPGTLVLPSPLVTLDDVEGKLIGIHTLRVAKRSLLTPAVCDELRRFKIKVVRDDVSSSATAVASNSAVASGYHIVAVDEKFNVIKSVAKQIAVNALPTSLTMLDIVGQLTKLDVRQRAIWCSTRPYAALLACSQASAHMRVACLHQAADLNQAVHEIQPNLLVLDDARWSGYQVGRLVQAWSRFGEQGGSK